MRNKIEKILRDVLPSKTHIIVKDIKSIFGAPQIMIAFAVSDYNINGVSGQKVQIVSLILNVDDMELYPQVFGGNGGQRIYRKPNLDDDKEKYLAMKSIKIPFRKPKQEEKFVLSAIKRFAENWLVAIKENKENLMYRDLVDYDDFLNS